MARTKIKVIYNPYRMRTSIIINGKVLPEDSPLKCLTINKRLQEWIDKFPSMLVDNLNTRTFDLEFRGLALDWDDVYESFRIAKANKKISDDVEVTFNEAKKTDDINKEIISIFNDLKNGPVEDFKDPKLIEAFNIANDKIFPITVIATVSSGKSTLINALLQKRLMPSKNGACTASITEITDNDENEFKAIVYNKDGDIIEIVPSEKCEVLTYEKMKTLNEDNNVFKISLEGDIPFLDCENTALKLVDTPGPNNSRNQAHKNITYSAINSNSNNLILYVLNGEQLEINDDANLLRNISEQINKGGKLVRDRFLFVVNRMDRYNPADDNIEKTIEDVKKYLAKFGINDPQLFFCSAKLALLLTTCLKNIDVYNQEEAKNIETIEQDEGMFIAKKFNKYEYFHLEKYSSLAPSSNHYITDLLARNKTHNNTTALIHSGIVSIQEAIKAYVKKYAVTKKIKDLVETFQDVLESTQVLAKVKTQVLSNEKIAKECAERARIIAEKINNGEEALVFKNKIDKLDPMTPIKNKAEELNKKMIERTSFIFEQCEDVITSKEEAKRLVSLFTKLISDCIAEISSELEHTINKELLFAGEEILNEYKNKVSKIDSNCDTGNLEFSTLDLIKGSLNNLRNNVKTWCSDDFSSKTIEEFGETIYETNTYYIKTGQEEHQEAVGTEQVKVGKKSVRKGSHMESRERTIKNPAKEGFLGKLKFWQDDYIQENYTVILDDYVDEPIYETIIKYQTVIKDIYEEKQETIEKFSVETRTLQTGLLTSLTKNLKDGIKDALDFAQLQTEEMKEQFRNILSDLDRLIQTKYKELEECSKDQKNKEAILEESRTIIGWIEENKRIIDALLDI